MKADRGVGPALIKSTQRNRKSSERGGTLIEFAVVSSVFFMMLLAICAGSALYFTHNAMVEATRRGARFAATQAASSTPGLPRTTSSLCDTTGPKLADIRNYTIYGNTAGTGPKLVSVDPANVCVEYSATPAAAGLTGFGVGTGAVSVSITGYTFNFVIPGINRQIAMPSYRTTAAGESAGTCPAGASPCT
jgi:Flp pilus assembly protein TadG